MQPLTSLEIHQALPTFKAAEVIFKEYITNLNWSHNIIHIPTAQSQIKSVYQALDRSERPLLNHLALVATIFAVTVYHALGSSELAISEIDAEKYCKWWILLAHRAMSEINHLNSPTLETIQALILLSQHLLTAPQISIRSSAQGLMINSAHQLQLHQVDSLRARNLRADKGFDAIELETKRRVWWNLATTDYVVSRILSFMGGPQLGTYMVHPSQMNVLYPSNIYDNFPSTTCSKILIHEIPTEMTYSIARIEASAIIRELVDASNAAGVETDDLDYGHTLIFDKKLNDLFVKFPCYYRDDDTEHSTLEAIYREKPFLKWQRDFFLFALHTRLLRLHRPFLLKERREAHYGYSREVCLHSTRLVMKMYPEMLQIPYSRIWILTYQLFLATATLVMDYCCHYNGIHQVERRSEIMQCYRLLDRDINDPALKQGLTQLSQIMDKWRATGVILDNNVQNRKVTQTWTDTNQEPSFSSLGSSHESVDANTRTSDITDPGSVPELWGFALDSSLDFDWTTLFHDFERYPASDFNYFK
ncbi:hypothetical protein F5884DRAFT_753320 [Xylogone sp. PMI_703]|nr:hypothetical protein F5884DRAFT_753320 [Xylogone sp. PMI_703]